jgi:hypothetical protein
MLMDPSAAQTADKNLYEGTEVRDLLVDELLGEHLPAQR